MAGDSDPLATIDMSTEGAVATVARPRDDTPSLRYELGSEIARGGMGIVCRATDTVLGREVAVKVLPAQFAGDTGAARRFAEEARITGRLQHPAIPPVHDLGTLPDGRLFLAMKLIEGQTLQALLKERTDLADGRDRFLAAFEQVCQAVAYAQSNGVIHRDLKSANIMVGSFGEVQVMDWGLAKVLRGSPVGVPERVADPIPPAEVPSDDTTIRNPTDGDTEDRTQAGQAMGTPAYMPPEQARGEWESVGPRADVFTLGGILCTILTGSPPYTGKMGYDVMKRAIAGDLADAHARLKASGADRKLVALAVRCLSAEPESRPADGAAVAASVAAYRQGVADCLKKAEAARAGAEAKASEQRKRRKVQLALTVAIALILVGSGVSAAAFAWWQDRQATIRQSVALQQQSKDREAAAENRTAMVDLVGRLEDDLRAHRDASAAALLAELDRRAALPGGEDLSGRIALDRKDLAMQVLLGKIDDDRWTPVSSGVVPPPSASAPAWAKAFADYGIVPGTTPPAEAAALVNRSPIRERLLAGLELWHNFGPPSDLTEILKAVDPDGDRDEFRAALREDARAGDWTRVEPLTRKLLEGPRVDAQPARFIAAVGILPHIPAPMRRALLERSTIHSPKDFGVLMGLGSTYPGNDPATAGERLRWYQSAHALRPEPIAPRFSLGIALFDAGKFEESIRCFREATRLHPTALWAHYNLGKVLEKTDALQEALTEYKQALRLGPNESWVHDGYGGILWKTGDLNGAIGAYKEAIRLDAKHAGAHYNLGNAYREKRDLKAAIGEYQESIRIEPGKTDALNALGNARWDTGDLKGAEASFRAAIASDKNFASARNNLGFLLKQKGDLPGAIAEYREVIRIDPKYLPARYNLGIALRANDEVDASIKVFRELLALAPDHAKAHNGLGNAYRDKDDWDSAIAEYKEALRIEPNNAAAKSNLAKTLKDKADSRKEK